MRIVRNYGLLPDVAACLEPGCPWHESGDNVEKLAETHADTRVHRVQILNTAKVLLTPQHVHAVTRDG